MGVILLIPEIDRLLEADKENTQIVKQVLYQYNPDILDIINQIAMIHATVCRSFGQGLGDHFDDINKQLIEFGVSSDLELEKKLDQPIPEGQEGAYTEAQDALYQYYSRENRGMLLGSLGVLYGMAVADLLKMRVTAPFVYLRLQCESLAIMKLMKDTPKIAPQWRKIETDEEGIKFYRSHQAQLKSILKCFDLAYTYEHTSGTAMHSRFARIARSLQVDFTRDDNKITQEIRVLAQEFDAKEPGFFINDVIFILRAQGRILLHLPVTCPEITDSILIETRIPKLLQSVDNQHALFPKKFPRLAERFRQIGLERQSP